MCYVMFDLAFQGQRSSHDIDIYFFEFRDIDFYSTYRHQTQVSTIYTTINIIINVLRHV